MKKKWLLSFLLRLDLWCQFLDYDYEKRWRFSLICLPEVAWMCAAPRGCSRQAGRGLMGMSWRSGRMGLASIFRASCVVA